MDELKAACLALAKEALKPANLFDARSKTVAERLEALLASVKRLRSELNPSVAEYVFFPLRSLLQQDSLGDRQTELLFRVLTELFAFAWNKGGLDRDRAQQLLAVSTFLLSPEPPLHLAETTENKHEASLNPPRAFLKKPTSLHAAGFECIEALYTAAANARFGAELGQSPTTAQVLTLLLDGIQYDTDDLDAQLASIGALHTIMTRIISSPDHRALVLPRLVSKLTKFVSPANRRHFKAKVRALVCLADVIAGTIGDNTWNDDDSGPKVRTQDWLQTAVTKLQDSFTVVSELQQSLLDRTGSRPELLGAIYDFSHEVFSKCSHKTLPEKASGILVQIMLLTTSQTLDSKLAERARAFLSSSSATSNLLMSEFLSQVNNLGAVLSSPNETKALTGLQSLQNSIELLGGTSISEVLVEAVESTLPLSVSKKQSSASEVTMRTIESYNTQKQCTVRFADLGLNSSLSGATQDAVARVLGELGKSAPPSTLEVLASRLGSLRIRRKASLDSAALLWITGSIMSGMPQTTDVHEIVVYCYEDLFDALNVQGTDPGAGAGSTNSVTAAAHTALACYFIGEAALKQGADFKEYFVDLIHPLFAMLGSMSSPYVREQAGLAISKVAYACGYASPTELAIDNKDYLVDGIALQLNTLNFTPGTMQALASLIYVSGSEILPHLDDVFSSLFVLMDHYHAYSRLVTGILTVFGALVSVLGQPSLPTIEQTPQMNVEVPDFAALLAELERKPKVDPSILDKKLDINKLAENLGKKDSDGKDRASNENERIKALDEEGEESLGESDEDDEEIKDEPEDALEKWDFPIAKPTYLIIQRIVAYCDRLMTHSSPEIRLATLSLTNLLMPYLAVNKEEFLPLVHKTWPEAVARVFDDEVYVVEQSLACLGSISQYAEAFVASRIDSLWPRLIKKYAPLLKKRWPQFSHEQRALSALAGFFSKVVQYVPDLSLQAVESGLIAYRPALLRGEFGFLKSTFSNAKPSLQDLLWLVLLDEPVKAQGPEFATVEPVYAN